MDHTQTQYTDHYTHRQATGISHEYFLLLDGISKHIEVKERNQNSQSGKGKHGVDIFMHQ